MASELFNNFDSIEVMNCKKANRADEEHRKIKKHQLEQLQGPTL
jgi:hypothetical protein